MVQGFSWDEKFCDSETSLRFMAGPHTLVTCLNLDVFKKKNLNYRTIRGNGHDDIDLLIVPGVCFDKDRNRIGFGKGYYDKYISNNYINTIGLCFSEQIVDYINHDSHDVKINKVITDTFDY